MDNILLAVTILMALITLYVAIRTIIDTRRRHYNDYKKGETNEKQRIRTFGGCY